MFESDGSVRGIEEIPLEVRDLYKTVWEIPQKCIINLAADRGIYVCQSQSMNLFIAEPNIGVLNSAHFYGWERGLKTGMYYLRTQPKAFALKGLGIDSTSDEDLACSIENPENCDSCGS